MTETPAAVRITDSIFGAMPRPLLFVLTGFLAVALGMNLLMPDFIPLLDELILAFLLYGSGSALLRRPGRELRPATEAVAARSVIKEAKSAADDLRKQGKKLRKEGHPVPALDGVAGVVKEVDSLAKELSTVDGWLSRKENDPWQVQRELDKLERAVAEAEAAGEQVRMDSLSVAVEGARMHADRVARSSAKRDEIVNRLRALSGQMTTLTETLKVVDERDAVPTLPDRLGQGWEPALAAVLEGLRDVAEARAELDAMKDGPRGRRSAQQTIEEERLAVPGGDARAAAHREGASTDGRET